MVSDNKDIIMRYYSLFFQGNEIPFDEFYAPSFIDHNGYPNQPPGPNGVKKGYEAWLKSFHIREYELADIVAENDKVVVRTKVSGIQREEYFNKIPSLKNIVIKAISIFSLSEGKITERWGLTTFYDDNSQSRRLSSSFIFFRHRTDHNKRLVF